MNDPKFDQNALDHIADRVVRFKPKEKRKDTKKRRPKEGGGQLHK